MISEAAPPATLHASLSARARGARSDNATYTRERTLRHDYLSNHASGSEGAAEILRRVYGAGGHDITMANPAVPGVTFHYRRFNQLMDDINDARVYGGIHFRFDQDAGTDLGRDVAAYIYKHNLRCAKHCGKDGDDGRDGERDGRSRHRD